VWRVTLAKAKGESFKQNNLSPLNIDNLYRDYHAFKIDDHLDMSPNRGGETWQLDLKL
jgi:hypothetical protein